MSIKPFSFWPPGLMLRGNAIFPQNGSPVNPCERLGRRSGLPACGVRKAPRQGRKVVGFGAREARDVAAKPAESSAGSSWESLRVRWVSAKRWAKATVGNGGCRADWGLQLPLSRSGKSRQEGVVHFKSLIEHMVGTGTMEGGLYYRF